MRFWVSGPRIGFLRLGVGFRAAALFGSARSAPGDFIYIIAGDHGLTKIGISRNPGARLATLQTGSAHRLRIVCALPGNGRAFEIEQEAHAILADRRASGEWFAVSPNIATAAIYGAAERLGVTMGVEPERIAAPSRLPKTWAGRALLAFAVLWVVGFVTRQVTPTTQAVDLGQAAIDAEKFPNVKISDRICGPALDAQCSPSEAAAATERVVQAWREAAADRKDACRHELTTLSLFKCLLLP